MINKTIEIFKSDIEDGIKGSHVGVPGGLPKLDKKIKNIQKLVMQIIEMKILQVTHILKKEIIVTKQKMNHLKISVVNKQKKKRMNY